MDGVGEFVDGPRVHRDAEAQLGFGLVAFGDGDVAHVVAEAGQLQRADGGPAGRGALPRTNLAGDLGVADMPDDGLPRHAEARLDVPEFAVAVGCLVEVHEVEVDVSPRQVPVGLGVEVQQRLAEQVQALDPHLGGAERVHPGGHADHGIIGVGFQCGAADGVGIGEDRLPDELDRDVAVGVQGVGDLLRLRCDLLEDVLAVEVLAAGEEPDLVLTQGSVICGSVGGAGHFVAPGCFEFRVASGCPRWRRRCPEKRPD